MLKRLFVFILLLLVLAGCADPTSDALRFGLANAPVTLDPRFSTDATSTRINRLLYQQLVDFDAASYPIPALATWKKLTPTHYRFTLDKEGRIFHNGSNLTASDVKATYDFVLDAKNASPHRAPLELIQRIEVVNVDTIDFYLNKADALFPGKLVVGIVPAALGAAQHSLNQNPVGSGAFSFVDWPSEGHLRLMRIADKQKVEFLHVPDPTVRAIKLMRGEIDMLQNDLPPELIRYLGSQKDMQVLRARGSNFSYLGFNLNDPVTGRLEVRRAIVHALDRGAIIKYVLGNAARPAAAMFPPDHWAGIADSSGYAYDPQQARVWLKKAGFSAEHPAHITYKTSSDPFRIRLATIIQSQLREVGIKVDLRSYDWGTFYGDIKSGSFQMFSLSWVGIKNPDVFHYAFHSTSIPPQGANRGRFSSPVVDHLIETAQAEPELPLQALKYREIQHLLLEKLPYVPLWYEDHIFIARNNVSGYTVATDGNYDGLIKVSGSAIKLLDVH